MSDRGMSIIKRSDSLKADRETLESYWADAYMYTFPHRGVHFVNEVDRSSDQGGGTSNVATIRAYKAKIFDVTAIDSTRLLASSIASGITPATSQWFNLTIPEVPLMDLTKASRGWLQNTAKTMWREIHNSNFDNEAWGFYLDIVIGGMACLYIDYKPNGGLIFEQWTLQNLYVKDTMKLKKIDTVYRELKYTAAQAAHEFGIDNLPQNIRDDLKNNPHSKKTFQFVHCIEPRMNKNGVQMNGKRKGNMPWMSVYVAREDNTIVKESGFLEFPLVIPRWNIIPDTEYALGPVDDALPDIKTLNRIEQMVLTNGEMKIAGTFVAKEDGILNSQTLRIGPRKIVFAADVNNIKPLTTGGDMGFAQALADQKRANIRRVLMSDQLIFPDGGPQMTAQEVNERVQIFRRQLAPMFARFQTDMLNGMVDRVYGLLSRNGVLDEPTDEINQEDVMPEYTSPLAKAAMMEDVENIERFESSVSNTIQLFPTQMDWYDSDEAINFKAQALSVPEKMIRSKADVERLRRERAKAQQEAAQQQAEAEALEKEGQGT